MGERRNKYERKTGISWWFLLASALIILCRFALDEKLTVREYTVTSPQVTGEHTFALLTDLHGTLYGKNQEKLAETVREYEPEAVFLVGDIIDQKHGCEAAILLFEQLADLPLWYVTGNHECQLSYTDDAKALMREYGVRALDNETVDYGDGIRLSGLDDPLFFKNGDAFLSELESMETSAETFDLLLAHRPNLANDYAEQNFDLVLCGHAHGGQVRIPLLLNGLYAPSEGWFPKFAGGRYDAANGCCMIVSRGLAKTEVPRVFNPPEAVIIHVKEER